MLLSSTSACCISQALGPDSIEALGRRVKPMPAWHHPRQWRVFRDRRHDAVVVDESVVSWNLLSDIPLLLSGRYGWNPYCVCTLSSPWVVARICQALFSRNVAAPCLVCHVRSLAVMGNWNKSKASQQDLSKASRSLCLLLLSVLLAVTVARKKLAPDGSARMPFVSVHFWPSGPATDS